MKKKKKNKLIAEFMELKPHGNKEFLHVNRVCTYSDMEYSSRWDWLMPVIIKIGTTETKYRDSDKTFFPFPYTFGQRRESNGLYMFRFHVGSLFQEEKLIDAAFAAVVEYLT